MSAVSSGRAIQPSTASEGPPPEAKLVQKLGSLSAFFSPLPPTVDEAPSPKPMGKSPAPPPVVAKPTTAKSSQPSPPPPPQSDPEPPTAESSKATSDKEEMLKSIQNLATFAAQYYGQPSLFLGNKQKISELLVIVKQLDLMLTYDLVPRDLLQNTKALLLVFVSKGKNVFADRNPSSLQEFTEAFNDFDAQLKQLNLILKPKSELTEAELDGLLEQAMFEEIVLKCTPIIAQEPRLLPYRCKAYLGLGEFSHALEDVNEWKRSSPDDWRAFFYEADCWVGFEDSTKARNALTAGRKQMPDKPMGYYRDVELRVQDLEDVQQNRRKIEQIPEYINQDAPKGTEIEHYNFILFGAYGSGKSSFVNTVARVLRPNSDDWFIAQTQDSASESTVRFGRYDVAPGLVFLDTRGLIQWEAKELEQVKMQLGRNKKIAKTGSEVKQREMNFFDKIMRRDKMGIFDAKNTTKLTLGNKPHFIVLVVSTAAPFPHQIDSIVAIATDPSYSIPFIFLLTHEDIGDVEKIRNEIVQLYSDRDPNIAHKIVSIENYHQKPNGEWTPRQARIEAQTLRILRIGQNRASEFVQTNREKKKKGTFRRKNTKQ